MVLPPIDHTHRCAFQLCLLVPPVLDVPWKRVRRTELAVEQRTTWPLGPQRAAPLHFGTTLRPNSLHKIVLASVPSEREFQKLAGSRNSREGVERGTRSGFPGAHEEMWYPWGVSTPILAPQREPTARNPTSGDRECRELQNAHVVKLFGDVLQLSTESVARTGPALERVQPDATIM